VQLAIAVRNAGSASADDVALKIRPPAGSALAGEGPGALSAPLAAVETTDTPFWQGDGTYTQLLAPGRYFVRVEVSPTLDFTTPMSATRRPTPTSS
jgi:hypothetical protein